MISGLIHRYRNSKKQAQLNRFSSYQYRYAFVGVGGHSINNLYPVLDFLGVPLKYICTRDPKNAKKLAFKYKDCTGTGRFEDLLEDKTIKGILISSAPEVHYALAKKALEAGKNIFIEKPPCKNTLQLDELIALSKNRITACGLQKRKAQVYEQAKAACKHPVHYHLHYATGAYPEGSALLDLFIHPLDLAVYLFGPASIAHFNQSLNKQTLLLTLQHDNGVIGQLELSTDYTWSSPRESLTIVDGKGIFESNGINEARFTKKGKKIGGLPLEKVFKSPTKTAFLHENSGFVPMGEFNPIYTHGFYPEISSFIDACEGKRTTLTQDLASLKPTYKLLDELHHLIHD